MKQYIELLACELPSEVPVAAQTRILVENDKSNAVNAGKDFMFKLAADPGDFRFRQLLLYRPHDRHDMAHVTDRRQAQNA